MTFKQLSILLAALTMVLLTGCETTSAFHKETIDGTEYTVFVKPGVEITPELKTEAKEAVASIAESRQATVTMTYDEAVEDFQEWKQRMAIAEADAEAAPLLAKK